MRLSLLLVVTFTLVGCNKKTAKNNEPPPPSGGGGGDGGPLGIVINPSAALPGGGGGGGGAAQAVRKAARRTQALNEMAQLGLVIEDLRDPTGRMPTKEQILAALKNPQYKNVLDAVTEGSFILTGTTEGGGLWAYEVDADTKPGIALIGGKATRSTPDELRPYLDQLPKPAAPPGNPNPGNPNAGRPNASGALDTRPMPPGQPTRPATPPAANVTKQDMEDIRIFIDNASGASGVMPSPQQTYAALVEAKSPAAELVKGGAITLTGTRTREGVWAYETRALQQGGMVVTAGGVETVTAAQLRQRLGQ